MPVASQEMPESLRRTDLQLQQAGVRAAEIASKLLTEENPVESVEAIRRRAELKSAELGGDDLERLLLWYAAREALARVATLPVEASVRIRLEQDLGELHAMKVSMEVGSYHFDRAAKMATLRRFPAGPMEWEMSGIPRSYFVKAPFPGNLRMLGFALFRLGGLAPCFFMHVAPAPRNRALRVPKEVMRAYYRIARSMQLQPEVRALLAEAWFHDPAALRDYPHLEALNRPYVEHGGLITLLGPAPPSSGVLEGNAQRSADYLAGKVQYRYGFAIWPREAAIRWADAHPELGA